MSYSGVDIWTQPNFSAGLPQELWQMNARGNAEFQQLYEAAYDQARRQGLAHDLAQDTAMRAARGIQGTGGMPDVWGDQRTVNLGGGLRRPVYPGAPRWSFEGGGGLSAEEARRSRMTEQLVVEARNNALAARRQDPLLPVASVQQATPASASFGRVIGVDDGLGFDPLALAGGTSGANAAKMDSTLSGLQQQPQRAGSGGAALDPLSAGLAAADMAAVAGDILPLTQGVVGAPDAAQAAVQGKAAARGMVPDPWGEPITPSRAPAAMPAAAEVGSGGPDLTIDATPNVSGGGPGTSTAKGYRNIASQRARRSEAARAAAKRALADRTAAPVMVDEIATGMGPTPLHRVAPVAPASAAAKGNGFLRMVDDLVMQPGHAVGVTAEQGLRNAAAMAYRADMHGIAGALKRAAPVARWAAPAGLFAATTGLPAVFGAIDGNEKAGVGGGMIQGGSALAGGLIGGLFGPIGAAIGSTIGGFAGGGLTSAAQALTGKAHEGDTGVMGNLGRMLDPIIDTEAEKEMKAFARQVNSPAMLAIRQQQQQRETQARIAMQDQAIMQMAMQGYY